MRINNDGIILPLFKAENLSENHQSLKTFIFQMELFIYLKFQHFKNRINFQLSSIPFFMDEEDSFDIDDKGLCIVRKNKKSMNNFKIKNRFVGDDEPPLIIIEIGINHGKFRFSYYNG